MNTSPRLGSFLLEKKQAMTFKILTVLWSSKEKYTSFNMTSRANDPRAGWAERKSVFSTSAVPSQNKFSL